MKKILFICTGNICRSPVAEAVLRKMAAAQNIPMEIDSAGTGNWHEGETIDPRAAEAAAARGYDTSSIRSRPITAEDFEKFDIIYAMTQEHCDHLTALITVHDLPPAHKNKIRLFLLAAHNTPTDVPDPYYGGTQGFTTMLNLIETACHSLLPPSRVRTK